MYQKRGQMASIVCLLHHVAQVVAHHNIIQHQYTHQSIYICTLYLWPWGFNWLLRLGAWGTQGTKMGGLLIKSLHDIDCLGFFRTEPPKGSDRSGRIQTHVSTPESDQTRLTIQECHGTPRGGGSVLGVTSCHIYSSWRHGGLRGSNQLDFGTGGHSSTLDPGPNVLVLFNKDSWGDESSNNM